MGQEIQGYRFSAEDFEQFALRLARETQLLAERLRRGDFERAGFVAGFELEGWILDRNYFPLPNNQRYLARLDHPLVVPELSLFNVELNGTPQVLRADALRKLEVELTATWRHCLRVAHEQESTLILIGILPTVRDEDLCLANMSPLNRYYALNQQVLSRRGGRAIELSIAGREELRLSHSDVMLEAATTSFQLHLQVPIDQFVRYFNASLILSAPMVALAANSPYLFEKSLWEETRVALFEQAVDAGESEQSLPRVTFGTGYLEHSVIECFRENLTRYPVLLPIRYDDAPAALRHLRLHNGTIWRWNRPLIGFDAAGVPHARVEHRVMPAGPSIVDMLANAALYYGAVRYLAQQDTAPEADLSFVQAKHNFYAAARDGLDAKLTWRNGDAVDVRTLLLDELLPMARHGLGELAIARADRDRYLGVIAQRVRSGRNGAAWQRAHVAKYGRDFFRLTADYLEHQRSAMPVHEWDV